MTDKVKSKPAHGAFIAPPVVVQQDGEWRCVSCETINVTEAILGYERCGKCGVVHALGTPTDDLDFFEGSTAVV